MSDALTVKIGAWEWTSWPTMWMPSEQWILAQARARGARWVDDFHKKRERFIQLERTDPLSYGWEAPPIAAVRKLMAGTYVPGEFGPVLAPDRIGKPLAPADDVLLMTGNRFGKSNFGGKLVNEVMEKEANAQVRCWSQSQDTSRAIQQKAIYKHLRPALRKVKRIGQFCKISYSGATGFTEETFLFPQGKDGDFAQCWFMTYHAWAQDNTIAEGVPANLIWCDEEVPAELMDTLRFRVGSTRLLMLVTFTPLSGYTDAVGQYIETARIIECVPARRVIYDFQNRSWSWGDWLLPKDEKLVEGCPPGHVPLILEHAAIAGRYTVCPATTWNPYVPLDEVLKKVANQSKEIKLIRIFGWPQRKVRPALEFKEVHLVDPDRIPPLNELTIYLVVDPCPPPRNWFMVWIGVDRDGRIWVLAEWPDAAMGEWAVPGKEPDGKPGPAAFDNGPSGFDGYKLLILEREGWEEDASTGVWTAGPDAVFVRDGDRLLDPRAASWKVPSQEEEEAKSYIDCLGEPVRRYRGSVEIKIAPGLEFERAPACHIQEGNELINGWMTAGWDPEREVDPMNCPRFYINRGGASKRRFLRAGCANTIWACRTFTGKKRSGAVDADGACKDPIDCLKGGAKKGIRWVPKGALGTYGGGHSY